jgi:hypothetical protein
MGAALTYARRYALFTLVGIAGEDDLDAPELSTAASQNGPLKLSVQMGAVSHSFPAHRNSKAAVAQPKPVLSADESGALREQLLPDVAGLSSPEEAATWAHRVLPLKNSLTLADAQMIEVAFASRMSALEHAGVDAIDATPSSCESGRG